MWFLRSLKAFDLHVHTMYLHLRIRNHYDSSILRSAPNFVRLKEVHEAWDFRVLRENRRIVKADDTSEDRTAQIETFHLVLSDIAMGVPSARVRTFLTQAYVRGMLSCGGTAVHALVLPKRCVRLCGG